MNDRGRRSWVVELARTDGVRVLFGPFVFQETAENFKVECDGDALVTDGGWQAAVQVVCPPSTLSMIENVPPIERGSYR